MELSEFLRKLLIVDFIYLLFYFICLLILVRGGDMESAMQSLVRP